MIILTSHACLSFLQHCTEERCLSSNTLAAYRQDLNEFRSQFDGRDTATISGQDLVAYASHLSKSRRLAPATVKRRIACLRSMFAWLTRRSLIVQNPFSTVELRTPIPDRLPRCISANDMSALVLAAELTSDATRVAVNLLFATGARVSELTAIRLEDVDAGSGSIRIIGKGNKERRVFVTDDRTLELLAEYLRANRCHGSPTDMLLVDGDGRCVSSASVRSRLKALSRSAGLLRVVTPHAIRHTSATALLEAGVDIRFVQRLLGHRCITTTQLYTHVSDSALKAAMSAAIPRRRSAGYP